MPSKSIISKIMQRISSGVGDYNETGDELGNGVPGFIPISRVIKDINNHI